MDKRMKSLALMAVCLVALCAVYFVTLNKQAEEETETLAQSGIMLIDTEGKEITSLKIRNDNEFVFNRLNNKWKLEGHDDFRLSNVNMSNVVNSLSSLQSQDTISGGDIAAFGLGEPMAEATLYFTDGSEQSVYVGKPTVDGKFYYAMAEGGDGVYTITKAAGEQFFYGYSNFLDKGVIQVAVTTAQEIAFRLNGKEYAFTLGRPYGVEYFSWGREDYIERNTGNVKRLDNQYAYANIYSWISNVRLTGVVVKDKMDIKEFGFDENCPMLRVSDGENVFHFYLGNDAGNGLRYVMFEGDKYVYTAKGAYFETFEAADISNVFDKRLTDVIPRQAETISIKGPGYNNTLKPLENEDDKKTYANIFNLFWDSFIEPVNVADKTPVWTMESTGFVPAEDINPAQINNNDGSYEKQSDGSIRYTVKYELYDYNEMFYCISRNGADAETAIVKSSFDGVFK